MTGALLLFCLVCHIEALLGVTVIRGEPGCGDRGVPLPAGVCKPWDESYKVKSADYNYIDKKRKENYPAKTKPVKRDSGSVKSLKMPDSES